ncbi:DUF5336 domain-containing protein [Gordonia soli]|uniref:Uncharacterized protein n=1 Tax=Gordonia soli NBRC 108243 TaxID=1223545 RepID=M0QIR4_9ACTN|nr:DUF5336 domain-containing protein [Gordonia soli]GAC68191.1 hypothetical protein GS4_14_00200 [Gordonia soli NBRC 108243]
MANPGDPRFQPHQSGASEQPTTAVPTSGPASGSWSAAGPTGPAAPGQQPGQQPVGSHHPGPGPAGPQPFGAPLAGPTGAWQPPPARTSRLDLASVLALVAVVAGSVAYFMGFVSWVTIPTNADRQFEDWASQAENGIGIPGFLSYDIVLNPGRFLIVLGVVALATLLVLAPRYRRALSILAVGAAAGWLGLFAAALAIPPFIQIGTGAILGLVFGFVQTAALFAAAFVQGFGRD